MLPRRLLIANLIAAGATTAGLLPVAAQPPQNVPAPEFSGITGWLNTAEPLTVTGLRGKVVLVDFWTYSCINCRRTVPYLNRWQSQYGAHGLCVVGIHTPEFGFEHMHHNVADSVREFGIRYPVGQDNDFRTWRAWGTEAWPTFALLDPEGQIVMVREGEGHAHEIEAAIRALLGLGPSDAGDHVTDDPDLSHIATPEIYFGSLHPTPQDRAQSPREGQAAYTFLQTAPPKLNSYQLDGTWTRQSEALTLDSAVGSVRLRFSAAKLHLVAAAPKTATLRVTVDREPPQSIELGRPTLYTLFDSETYTQRLVTLHTETPGVSLFSATFG